MVTEGGVSYIVVSADETMVASTDCRIRLWNVKEASIIGDPWVGHNARLRCLDWSPDAREIASGSDDASYRIEGLWKCAAEI